MRLSGGYANLAFLRVRWSLLRGSAPALVLGALYPEPEDELEAGLFREPEDELEAALAPEPLLVLGRPSPVRFVPVRCMEVRRPSKNALFPPPLFTDPCEVDDDRTSPSSMKGGVCRGGAVSPAYIIM
jgi:hypothetical protein